MTIPGSRFLTYRRDVGAGHCDYKPSPTLRGQHHRDVFLMYCVVKRLAQLGSVSLCKRTATTVSFSQHRVVYNIALEFFVSTCLTVLDHPYSWPVARNSFESLVPHRGEGRSIPPRRLPRWSNTMLNVEGQTGSNVRRADNSNRQAFERIDVEATTKIAALRRSDRSQQRIAAELVVAGVQMYQLI